MPAGTVALPTSRLSTHTEITLPVRVLHDARPGPVPFISAGVHGDEIMGVEVIRRLMGKVKVKLLAGTLICIPVVNVFGFVQHQRYLPDRRDLNRCFPGSSNGSLAAQLANVFNEEIIKRSNFGIDLHSAALHRTNLPQIRISDDRAVARELAMAFGAPAIITAPLRQGSLRSAALASNVDVILYEAGAALRFDELSIRVGLQGILRVMAHLEMSTTSKGLFAGSEPIQSRRTLWVRAPEGGIFRMQKQAGARVRANDVLGVLSDPSGDTALPVRSPIDDVIIGRTNLPVVIQGETLMHIAEVLLFDTTAQRVTNITKAVLEDPSLGGG